jgi:hypothetical protein
MSNIEEAAVDILLPVLETSIVLAGYYTKQCNRDTVTAHDLNYAMKFVAMNHVGKNIGSLFPHIYDSSDSDEEEDEDDDDEEEFIRYEGDDQICLDINNAYDKWEEWEPTNIAERMLKNAIDNRKI